MRHSDEWTPTKFVLNKGRWVGSRDPRHLSPGSRLMADTLAPHYEKFIPEFARGRLADLGCGSVPLYAIYGDYVDDVICADWPQSLHGDRYLDLACDLNEQLPFRDASFGTILLSSVLEHIAEPQHLWFELSRIAEPDGVVLLDVPFLYWIHEQPHDYFRYTEFALRRLAETAGFAVRLIAPLGGVQHVVADTCAKVLYHRGFLGRTGSLAIQRFAARLSQTKLGERMTGTTSSTFALGYFMVAEKATGPADSGRAS